MFIRLLKTLLAVLCVAAPLHAQTIRITGEVRDAATREPLQFANIRIENSLTGTTSDRHGRFTLSIEPGSHILITSYMGYRNTRTPLNPGTIPSAVTIDLVPSSVELPEVTVTPGDNPALRIIRQAIEEKEKRKKTLENYRLTSHSKLVVSIGNLKGAVPAQVNTDSSFTAILESQTDAWWARPDRYKEVIKARKQTAFIPAQSNILISSLFITDFSADNLRLGDKGAIAGPISAAGLNSYSYTLQGMTEFDGRPAYKIAIEPMDDIDPLLRGTIYIADSSYALTMVDVALNEAALPSFFTRLAFRQNFRLFNSMYWMPVDVGVDAQVNVSLLISFTLGIEGFSVLQDYAINTPFEADVFDRTRIKVLKEADTRDSTYWIAHRKIPNTMQEIEAYRKADSIKVVMDSTRNSWGFSDAIFGKDLTWDERRLSLPGLFGLYRFNRAEGHALYPSFRMHHFFDPFEDIRAEFGYGFNDRRWKYELGTTVSLSQVPRVTFGIDIFDRLAHVDEADALWNQFTTTTSNLVSKYDFKDYYYARGLKASAFADVLMLFPTTVTFTRSTESSAHKTTDWSIFRQTWLYRDIPPITDGTLTTIGASTSFDGRDFIDNAGVLRRFGGRSHIPTIGASWNRFEAPAGARTYWLYTASLRGRFDFGLFGTSSYRVSALFADASLPSQHVLHLPGSVDYLTQEWRFRTLDIREIGGDRRAMAFVSHDFGDKIFRMLRIPWLDASGLGLVVFGSAGWTEMREGTRAMLTVPVTTARAPFYEAGFSIDRILLILRLDFAWRLSHFREGRNFAIGLSTPITN